MTPTYIEGRSIPVPESGCWLWLGATNDKGYGLNSLRAGPRLAHRASYETFVGEIPEGLGVCHKCDTRSCVNPSHLFVGDQRANMGDAAAKGRLPGQQKTHCLRGHAFTEQNTKILRGAHRECRECARIVTRERMRKHRAALNLGDSRE